MNKYVVEDGFVGQRTVYAAHNQLSRQMVLCDRGADRLPMLTKALSRFIVSRLCLCAVGNLLFSIRLDIKGV